MTTVSALVLTKDEGLVLRECLQSLAWCSEVVVYDSYSSDDTAAIALEMGARVVYRHGMNRHLAFGGSEAEHRNWGLREISFKSDWILILDADERISSDSQAEILRVTSQDDSDISAYMIARDDYFMGNHLRYCQATRWYIRLLKPKHAEYRRSINCNLEVNGKVGQLNCKIKHLPFAKGISHWVDRHNMYSTREAHYIYSRSESISLQTFITALLGDRSGARRKCQKAIFQHLPLQPFLRFFIMYFLKAGFLDGRAGLIYCSLMAYYELLIGLKVKEIYYSNAGGSKP